MKKFLIIIFTVLSLVSCTRRPLDVLATSLRVNHKPDYSLQYEKPSYTPEHFRVNMYDASTGKMLYQDFVPEKGGAIRSTPGKYFCYLCNFDTPLILQNESDMNRIYLTAPEAGEKTDSLFESCRSRLKSSIYTNGSLTENEIDEQLGIESRVLEIKDYFWAGGTGVSVPCLSEIDKTFEIDVETFSSLKQGKVTLMNIVGIEYISRIECFLTNFSSGKNPISGELDPEDITLRFTLKGIDGNAQGTFLYFGLNHPPQETHLLYALVTDTGGGQYLYVYDFGPLNDENGLEFVIDSKIVVPEPIHSGGGGFNPELDDWNVEYIDVPMG